MSPDIDREAFHFPAAELDRVDDDLAQILEESPWQSEEKYLAPSTVRLACPHSDAAAARAGARLGATASFHRGRIPHGPERGSSLHDSGPLLPGLRCR